MSDAGLILLAFAPVALVAIVALVRGYSVTLHVRRPGERCRHHEPEA